MTIEITDEQVRRVCDAGDVRVGPSRAAVREKLEQVGGDGCYLDSRIIEGALLLIDRARETLGPQAAHETAPRERDWRRALKLTQQSADPDSASFGQALSTAAARGLLPRSSRRAGRAPWEQRR